MTKDEAMKKLEGKTGWDKWLIRKLNGDFAIISNAGDPHWIKEAMYLFSKEQIEAAAEWLARETA